ncbi:MAG: FecR domain-containing protein [Steroidobacteraceae bacterium]|nr:FecR domain-containing protein [Steroidobacteraceae bacterium]
MTKKAAGDSSIETLVRLAGSRDAPSAQGMERARAAAFASWQQGLRAADAPRPPPHRVAWWAVAAGLMSLAIVGAWYWRASPAVIVARVAAVSGDVRLTGARAETLVADSTVLAGESLESRSGRIALSFGALSLRVDRDTRLRLDAPDRVTLVEGNVYVDSGGVNASTALSIATPAGEIRHIGTQFLVNVTGGVTRVQVREGRVTLETTQGSAHEVSAGERLDVDGAHALLMSTQVSHGVEWEWAAAIAPGFDVENRPLAEFLAWIAREHGWQLRYGDATLQSRAQAVRLHGSLEALEANAMIERVSLITGIPMSLRDGALIVGPIP